jgi:hypothetical protein
MSPTKFLAKVLESPKFADGGRSGSFFCFSPDGKYIIKTIPEAEFSTFSSLYWMICKTQTASKALKGECNFT